MPHADPLLQPPGGGGREGGGEGDGGRKGKRREGGRKREICWKFLYGCLTIGRITTKVGRAHIHLALLLNPDLVD